MSKNKNYMMIMMVALVAILLMVLPVSASSSVVVGKIVNPGATVFIGEEGLDISSAMGGYTTIGYWAAGADLVGTAPSVTVFVPLSGATSFSISASNFKNYVGNWYRVTDAGTASGLAFRVADPSLSVLIENANTFDTINGRTVVVGTPITFKIDTNIRLDGNRGDGSTHVYAPVSSFIASINATTGEVKFTDQSSNMPTSWAWNFGDSAISALQNPVHTYASSGNYTVVLSITNSINNAVGESPSIVTNAVNVTQSYSGGASGYTTPTTPVPTVGAPISGFTAAINPITGDIQFTDTSSNVPTEWSWNFGDGATAITQNPVHNYASTGSHIVVLSTANAVNNAVGDTKSVITATVNVGTTYSKSVTLISFTPGNPLFDNVATGVNTTNGYIDIIVKSESGASYSSLQTPSGNPASLQKQFIGANPYYWNNAGSIWATAALIGGQRMYQSGDYKVWVECNLNGMKENYKDSSGAYYTGKTVSSVSTVTLGSDTLSLTSNKASVVRGKPFSVTVTGAPNAIYKLWIKGIYPAGTTPIISDYQEGVTKANSTFASISTDSSGGRVIGFTTSSDTKEQKYTIRVESTTGIGQVKSDEVAINVAKGGMTLVAAGNQNYYLGEDIKLSGTNSETETTYLFIVGPNLDSNGAQLTSPRESVESYDASTFTDVSVDDGTFTYTWATASVDLDSGTYTIYGVSQPVDRSDLQNTSYATVSVVIKKPYVSARASQSTIAKGDKLFIEGDAQGDPSSGVAVWILGKNYAKRFTESIDSDSTYQYEIPGAETSSMASGQYFIVVQHPMQNGVFDIDIIGDYVENRQLGSGSGTTIFRLYGSGSLQGSDAAEALIQAISDPNVDDTYTKLTIIVSEPLITIDPISDRHIGDKFNISGKTNLAVDDEILMEVYSSSFKPTQKVQSGEFSGATGSIKVVKGEGGMNTFSFNIDASTFKVDEYIVVAQSIVQDATGTALFNVVEGASTNPVVTPVVPIVTAPPVIVTAIPTVPPTAPPTAIPTTIVPTTTKSPGFGAVFALIGLGAVGFMVVRRE